NDQMFAEFGIKRTAAPTAGLPTDDFALAPGGVAPTGSGRLAAGGGSQQNPYDGSDLARGKSDVESKAKGAVAAPAEKEAEAPRERRAAVAAPTAAEPMPAPRPPAPAPKPAAPSRALDVDAPSAGFESSQPMPMPSVAADKKSEAPATIAQGAGPRG